MLTYLNVDDAVHCSSRLNEIYVEHTGKSLQEIEDNLERDRFMSATEALEYANQFLVFHREFAREH